MSDGSPIVGPKAPHPGQGQPRLSPQLDQSRGYTGMPGIYVIPWRLYKESEKRTLNLGTYVYESDSVSGTDSIAVGVEIPIDAVYRTLE